MTVFEKCMLHCSWVEDFCKRLKGTVRAASSESTISSEVQSSYWKVMRSNVFLSQNVLEKLGCLQTAVVKE